MGNLIFIRCIVLLVFNCTKAAETFFSVTRNGQKESPIQAPPTSEITDTSEEGVLLSPWILHAIRVDSKHVIIAMEVNTRFSMFFADLKKGDVFGFVSLFFERWFNHMEVIGKSTKFYEEDTFEGIFARFSEVHNQAILFCTRGNSSVQGSINRNTERFKKKVFDSGCLPNNFEQATNFDMFVNSMPRKGIKKREDIFFPDDEMFVIWNRDYYASSEETVLDIRSRLRTARNAYWDRKMGLA